MDVEFEWDENKAASNLRKHGVAFEDAAAVFSDRRAITDPARQVDDEERFKTTGHADSIALLTVIHTRRRSGEQLVLRLISARAASRRERRNYVDHSIQEKAAD